MCPASLAITEVSLCSHILSLSLHLGKKNKIPLLPCVARSGRSVKVMKLSSTDKCCVHMNARQLAERFSSGCPRQYT